MAYNRKYYLVKRVKALSLMVRYNDGEKTVFIPYNRQEELKDNKYLKELRDKYGYGLQTETV